MIPAAARVALAYRRAAIHEAGRRGKSAQDAGVIELPPNGPRKYENYTRIP
jgi:hypothetical protein